MRGCECGLDATVVQRKGYFFGPHPSPQPLLQGAKMFRGCRGQEMHLGALHAYQETKGRFLRSLALLRAGQGPCEKCEITVSTNSGLHVCIGWNTTYAVFHLAQLAQSKFPKLIFLIL